MTGTSTSRTIAGTALAASSLFTVTRTSSEPAAWSARTWAAVALASAVSVLVMDWTTIGWQEPTGTPPTRTVTVCRRRISVIGREYNRDGYRRAATLARARRGLGMRSGGTREMGPDRKSGVEG